jgi:hypothetical protein
MNENLGGPDRLTRQERKGLSRLWIKPWAACATRVDETIIFPDDKQPLPLPQGQQMIRVGLSSAGKPFVTLDGVPNEVASEILAHVGVLVYQTPDADVASLQKEVESIVALVFEKVYGGPEN